MTDHAAEAQLQRSLTALTAGVPEAHEELERELEPTVDGHFAQQLQVPLSGEVGSTPVWTTFSVYWPHPFLMRVAPSRQAGSIKQPHFASGIELKSDARVIIEVQVMDWIENDSAFLKGAKMRAMAWAPGAGMNVRYSALLHMTFSGYAAPSDDDSGG